MEELKATNLTPRIIERADKHARGITSRGSSNYGQIFIGCVIAAVGGELVEAIERTWLDVLREGIPISHRDNS